MVYKKRNPHDTSSQIPDVVCKLSCDTVEEIRSVIIKKALELGVRKEYFPKFSEQELLNWFPLQHEHCDTSQGFSHLFLF